MEVLAVGLAHSLVTELIKSLLMYSSQTFLKCGSEVKDLHDMLQQIMPNVAKIEKRVATLRENECDAEEDLEMVEEWLNRLKAAIEAAKIDVYKCNSGSKFSLDQFTLKGRIESHKATISSLAQNHVLHFTQLRSLMKPSHSARGTRRASCQGLAEDRRRVDYRRQSLDRPHQNGLNGEDRGAYRVDYYRQPLDSRSHQNGGLGIGEGDRGVHRADYYRQSLDRSSYNGYCFPGTPPHSAAPSSRPHSPGDGNDLGMLVLQRMNSERAMILQREECHRAQMERRQQGTSSHSQSSIREPCKKSWKY